MGFEDDIDYNNSFETDIADLDGGGFGEKPKKLSRKELREAKKKNAEKTADLPKRKKGLFSRHERMDDDDSLSGQHLFDPTQGTRISNPREHKSDYDTGPIRNYNSEFSYLFDPADDDETEDDVYPDESIYSDSDTARDLLGGLAYDESKDGDSADFDRYFREDAEVRPPSRFSFHKREECQNAETSQFDDNLTDISDTSDPLEMPAVEEESVAAPRPVKVVAHPVIRNEASEADSYLPKLRPDSVFASGSTQAPVEPKAEEREESYMPQDNNDFQQDYVPYQMPNVYQPYPIQPMNQMMYPMMMPNAGQAQGMPYQAIPIPYPIPMPYPMYSQGYYPPYPPGYPPYGAPDYYGRYAPPPYDDRYDGRRNPRGYDDRYDTRRAPDGHYDPYYGEKYDERNYRDRESYPRPPYQHPYDRDDYRRRGEYDNRNAVPQQPTDETKTPEVATTNPYTAPINITEPTAPVASVNAEPISTDDTAYTPITTVSEPIAENNFSSLDFTFNSPVDNTANQTDNDFDLNSLGQNDLGMDGFESNSFGSNNLDSSDFNDFGSDNVSGFENYSDNGNDFSFNFDNDTNNADAPVEEGKPRGGRFKKRR